MIFYLGEAVLLVALVLTSLQVLRMRRELQRMRAYQAEFHTAFGKTEAALGAIQLTIRELQASGRDVIEELGLRIDDGKRLIDEIKASRSTFDQGQARPGRGLNAA
ncbi:hypothetical protein [Bosea sp. PAMC 26642]|uniref:hypothetical protein n=1 Tax=Bosea sp. (strain PAMC 26642) TaxID=1792307 RepID=UPI0007705E00|nr:hypothetical protein [Bosea sp. PAMC 26642]AMJ62647.1 hypothetical protein AXW83_22215 [Bosea sp. PAMC 26642]